MIFFKLRLTGLTGLTSLTSLTSLTGLSGLSGLTGLTGALQLLHFRVEDWTGFFFCLRLERMKLSKERVHPRLGKLMLHQVSTK